MQDFTEQSSLASTDKASDSTPEHLPSTDEVVALLDIAPSSIELIALLTPMQRDLYLNYLINPDPISFSIGMVIRLGNDLNTYLWQRAISLVVDHESILRTVFLEYGDSVFQVALQGSPCHFEIIDQAKEESDEDIVERTIKVRHDLFSVQPAFKNFLVKDWQGQYKAITACHHILCDGPAIKLFLDHVGSVYAALLQNQAIDMTSQKSFYDCLTEVRAQFDSAETQAYWRKALQPVVPLTAYQGTEIPESKSRTRIIEGEDLQRIKEFCEQQEYSLPTYFRFLYCILLSKYYEVHDDFVIYSLINGRPRGYQDTLGCFYQVLPIVISGEAIRPETHFDQLLMLSRNYRKTPGTKQNISTSVLGQLLKHESVHYYYNYYNFGCVSFLGQNLPFDGYDYYGVDEVHLVVNDQEDRIELQLYYDQSKFTDTRFLERLLFVSQQVIDGVRYGRDLRILLPREQQNILQSPITSRVPEESLANLFAAQAAHTPDAIAVSIDDQYVSYQKLDERATNVAWHIMRQGIQTEALVALYAGRDIDFLTAILAIYKAGGAYLPLSPYYPTTQLTHVLTQSRVSLVLVSRPFLVTLEQALQHIPVESRPAVRLLEEIVNRLPGEKEVEVFPVNMQQNHMAYVIYTSGSTGMPKGVMIEQKGMLNHLLTKIGDLGLSACDSVAQTASQAFDISVWQWLACLLVGGRVHIIADEEARDPVLLLKQVEQYQVTVLELVPSLIQRIFLYYDEHEDLLPSLRQMRFLLSTGEALTPELAQKWLNTYPHIPLVNAYGPTECSDDITHYFLSQALPSMMASVPIGHALANMQLYVLDHTQRPVPHGVPGELHVGGIGVGRGYMQEATKTAAVFLPDPFDKQPGRRMYKTGDLVRVLADGNLQFLGRVDYQTKINGFRIELGEVEASLRKHQEIREVVVVAQEVAAGDKRLIAYIVTTPKATLSAGQLRNWMRAYVPEYSIPSAFVILESLPYSASGKVDRKALPLPDLTISHEDLFVNAHSLTEKELVGIWSQVLGVHRISIHDSFFALGGNSILGIHIITKIRELLHTNISLRTFLLLPTVEKLAEYIDNSVSEEK